MIPADEVIEAVLVALRGVWDYVGDGDPPVEVSRTKAYGWVSPISAPPPGPRYGGVPRDRDVGVRVSCAAVDGDSGKARLARTQTQRLSARFHDVIMTGPMLSGPTWRVTSRLHIAHGPIPEDGAWAIHDDYRLTVSASAVP